MPRRLDVYSRLPLALAVGLVCLVFAGCGGGGGSTSTAYLSDDFSALSSGSWNVNASVATVDGKLKLSGAAASAAEVRSADTYLYKYLLVTASSDTWAAGTSVGFDATTNGVRQAVIIDQGQLVVINQSAPGTKQASVPITGWNNIKSASTKYLIKWQAGKVELYASDTLVATYQGTLAPSVALPVRFACDSGRLSIASAKISDDQSSLYEADFMRLDGSQWTVPVGSLVTTTADGKLLMRSTSQASAEIVSKGSYQFKKIDFVANGDWGSDTFIGFDAAVGGGHYQIGVENGKYTVSAPSGTSAEDIIGWSTAKTKSNTFKIKWANGLSQLLINNFLKETYSGDYLSTSAANVRIYVGTAQPGQMYVDSVLVQDFL